MATVEIQTKVCDRCQFGKCVPATEERKWSIGEDSYISDLCEKHAAQFDREFGAWACMARPDEHAYRPPAFFNSEDAARDRRAAELRARQQLQQHPVTTRHIEPVPIPAPTPIRPPRSKAEAIAAGWMLVPHAEQRAVERDFDVEELLLAAADPQRTHPQPHPEKYGERSRIHVRGDCAVAVDPVSKLVLTVMPRDDSFLVRERIAH